MFLGMSHASSVGLVVSVCVRKICPSASVRLGLLGGYNEYAEYSLFLRALLQKRPIILRSLRKYVHLHLCVFVYWVATMSRLLKIIGLFCKRAL